MPLGTTPLCSSVNLGHVWILNHVSKKLPQLLKFAMSILLVGPTGSSRILEISQLQPALAARVSITKMELFSKIKSLHYQEPICKWPKVTWYKWNSIQRMPILMQSLLSILQFKSLLFFTGARHIILLVLILTFMIPTAISCLWVLATTILISQIPIMQNSQSLSPL